MAKQDVINTAKVTLTDKEQRSIDTNNVLVTGLVKIIKTPISERYCKVGDEATLDVKNKQIRCGGAWFNFDDRWLVQPCH